MALKIDGGKEGVKRGDLYYVDPFAVIVREELRGRHTPPTDQDVVMRAMSMAEHGQLQPVEARRSDGNKLLLTMGFTRCAAARLIRDGFTGPDGKKHQDKEFRLQVKITDCNDETALMNIDVQKAQPEVVIELLPFAIADPG